MTLLVAATAVVMGPTGPTGTPGVAGGDAPAYLVGIFTIAGGITAALGGYVATRLSEKRRRRGVAVALWLDLFNALNMIYHYMEVRAFVMEDVAPLRTWREHGSVVVDGMKLEDVTALSQAFEKIDWLWARRGDLDPLDDQGVETLGTVCRYLAVGINVVVPIAKLRSKHGVPEGAEFAIASDGATQFVSPSPQPEEQS